jgi:SAM-dependent methyltransferase
MSTPNWTAPANALSRTPTQQVTNLDPSSEHSNGMLLTPNRLLRPLGLEFRRITKAPAYPAPPEDERLALEAILTEFANSLPVDSICADVPALRDYLNNRRITLFHSLIDVAQRAGVDFNGRHIADIGTGTGYLLRVIAHSARPASLAGFDTFDEMLGLARRLCPQARIDQRSLYAVDGTFDLVLCTETLEHLIDPAKALDTLYRHVVPGGALLLTVPDGRHDTLECGELREDGSAYWGHIHFWSPESWRLFLGNCFGGRGDVRCDRLSTGENFAAVHKPADA